jgi:steroid 5-alpha reductase family enzyme
MSTIALYGSAAATVIAILIPLWIVSVAIKDASIVDVFWTPLFVAIAWVLFALGLSAGAVGGKQLVVLLLATM